MPQLESLSMGLARLAGVDVCEFELAPMSALAAPHRYDLGDELAGQFLAVTRFDRGPRGSKVHFEDFAQVFGRPPEQKYAESYLAIAAVLLGLPRCGRCRYWATVQCPLYGRNTPDDFCSRGERWGD